MSTHSTSSYSLSLLLHGAFVAALVFTAFAFNEEAKNETTKIFELVAGAGDNWGATEAPAIGTPEGVKFQPSANPVVQPTPAPVAPQPEPVAPAPVQPSPIVATPVEPPVTAPKIEPKKTPPPQKTFAQQVEQVAARKERQLMTKYRKAEAEREKKEAAAEAKRKAAEAAAAKQMSYSEFSKNNPRKVASNNAKTGATSYEKISTKGIAGGVDGGTTDKAGSRGKVLSWAELDQLGTYFAMLKQRVRDAHVLPLGVNENLSARVSFHVAESGAISQVKIIRSSGSADFDQSVIAAFKAVGSIGKRPDERGSTLESDFKRADD
jgi:colicin import membrane protein